MLARGEREDEPRRLDRVAREIRNVETTTFLPFLMLLTDMDISTCGRAINGCDRCDR